MLFFFFFFLSWYAADVESVGRPYNMIIIINMEVRWARAAQGKTAFRQDSQTT